MAADGWSERMDNKVKRGVQDVSHSLREDQEPSTRLIGLRIFSLWPEKLQHTNVCSHPQLLHYFTLLKLDGVKPDL